MIKTLIKTFRWKKTYKSSKFFIHNQNLTQITRQINSK